MVEPVVEAVAKAMEPGVWAQFGPMGLVALALFAFLWKLLDTQRMERQEMRKEAETRAEQMMTLQRETNLAIQGLTVAINQSNERWRRGDGRDP